ncbi:ATP-binding protein [Streptomyces sp. NPDC002766]|uniref:ATP-binding protein n=1 Tax=Streptomyces sp. NPDC002766 TaxID=3154429 RepID=UPI0033219E46
MWKAVRQAARATLHLAPAAALAFGLWLFITVLLITAVGTVVVVGAWLLPETVLLLRRIAGAKRAMTAGWTGQRIPEAYRPLTGTLREVEGAVEVEGLAEDGPRAPAAVEAAAYFVVAEALTNAAKHSGSSRASVRLVRLKRGLRVRVADEGRGGADESGGSGLLGIRRRVAALDGTMEISSQPGGPTTIDAALPCVW